ncbi:MAG: leucyl aminopeptidase [Proteobacteria bacterium]|nr:leucyl aminopeptidase [Pseudomonadota bacterium]
MIKIVKTKPAEYTGDMLVYLVRQIKKTISKCDNRSVQEMIDRAIESGDFSGKEGQTFLYYPEVDPDNKKGVRRILVIGMGKEDPDRELFRKAGGTIASTVKKTKALNIMVVAPETTGMAADDIVECLAEGVLLGNYQFKKYKTGNDPEDEDGCIKEVVIFAQDEALAKKGMKRGRIASDAVSVARDMANEPANFWTPTDFGEFGKELARKYPLKVKVLGKSDITKLKMGGLLAVNQGSAIPPTMTIVEYRTGKKVPKILLVGKGLTFDSGGISIKSGSGMHEMKYDMCGGAAVLAVMQAIGEERPNHCDVIAIVPATENMPGPSAVKPGDVITHYGGKTVEVINTDAEGRLILADALAYGVEKFKPDAVIDLATLTGAVVVGLGHHRTGLMSTDDRLAEKLIAAGARCGEPLWRLPLGPEYTKQLKSTVADLKNIGNRTGGTITAGAFLQEFVGDVPWAHLDIAGTAWDFTEKSYIPKGPSGVGVRTLLELVRHWKRS